MVRILHIFAGRPCSPPTFHLRSVSCDRQPAILQHFCSGSEAVARHLSARAPPRVVPYHLWCSRLYSTRDARGGSPGLTRA